MTLIQFFSRALFLIVFHIGLVTLRTDAQTPLEIPIKIVRGDMLVPLEINGKRYRFVLDSGASNSLLLLHAGTTAFDALESDGIIELTFPLTDKTVEARRIDALAARIGGATLPVTNAALVPWAETGLFAREQAIFYDGILGRDLFEQYIVEFDRDAKVIRLHDKESGFGDDVVQIPFEATDGLFHAEIAVVTDEGDLKIRALIDTGYPGSLALYGMRENDIRALTSRYGPHVGSGRRVEVRMGPCTLHNVRTIAFRETLPALPDTSGVIGIDFLEHFRFALDLEKSVLIFFGLEKAACTATLD